MGTDQSPDLICQVPAYTTLGEQYGLADDMHIAGPNIQDQQTIEQEFQAYITSPVSNAATNIIKFWEVCASKTHNTFI